MRNKLHMPWNNLGCLGLTIGGRYRGDVFTSPYFGLYVNDGVFRRRYALPSFRLTQVQVLDAQNAARIFRRTMKPYTVVADVRGREWILMSYPFEDEDGSVRVMAKEEENDELIAIRCEMLRPIQFYPRVTGIGANDPLPQPKDRSER